MSAPGRSRGAPRGEPGANRGTRRLVVASPRLPTGVSFPVNVLLELGVYGTSAYEGDWLPEEDGGGPDGGVVRTVSRFLPYFLDDPSHDRFEPGARFTFDHVLPHPALVAGADVALWVRDVRDTCVSHHRTYAARFPRWSLEGTLALPASPFLLPPQDTWALYYLLWIVATPAERLLVLRHHEVKSDPVGTLGELLARLGLRREPAAIEEAVSRSSVARARAAVDRHDAVHGAPVDRWQRLLRPFGRDRAPELFRKGGSGHGLEALDAEAERRSFGPLVRLVSEKLGLPLREPSGMAWEDVDRTVSWLGEPLGDPDLLAISTRLDRGVGLRDARRDAERLARASGREDVRLACRQVLWAFRWLASIRGSDGGKPLLAGNTEVRLLRALVFALRHASVPWTAERAALLGARGGTVDRLVALHDRLDLELGPLPGGRPSSRLVHSALSSALGTARRKR